MITPIPINTSRPIASRLLTTANESRGSSRKNQTEVAEAAVANKLGSKPLSSEINMITG